MHIICWLFEVLEEDELLLDEEELIELLLLLLLDEDELIELLLLLLLLPSEELESCNCCSLDDELLPLLLDDEKLDELPSPLPSEEEEISVSDGGSGGSSKSEVQEKSTKKNAAAKGMRQGRIFVIIINIQNFRKKILKCQKQAPAATFSPAPFWRGTFGGTRLSFRVRYGHGRFPRPVAAGAFRHSSCGEHCGLRHSRLAGEHGAGMAGPISGARLSGSRRLRLRPIHAVFSGGPSRPNLGRGFALRCFQRFSAGRAATRPCRWRDSRLAVGAPVPVLSY